MKQCLLFVLAWIFLFVLAFSEGEKLLFVQILFRHGDRTPKRLYPNDPNPVSLWPEGLSALTKLGKRQQYALGKYFRSRYETFKTSSPLEVNVISSAPDHCLNSALTTMASFYAPDSEWSIDSNLAWQPIPIHYLPPNEDKYLKTLSDCPRSDEETQKVIQSPEAQKFLKEHEEMFKNLATLSGFALSDWEDAYHLQDTLAIEKKHNLSIPAWVEPYWDELCNVANLSFFWEFNSPLLKRLRAGPLIQKIIETMNQKLNGTLPNLKFQIYSGHDANMAAVLDALNLFNMIQPPYASALLFELFEMPDGMKTVRMLYQNSSKPEEKFDPLHLLILDGCSEFCPLNYFINYTRPFIPEDWNLECQPTKSFIGEFTIGWFFLVIAGVITVIGVFLLLWMYFRKQKREDISADNYTRLNSS